MYASHPPNDLREKSATVPFIDAVIDERSPWVLIENHEALQKEVTKLVYNQYLDKEKLEFDSESKFSQISSPTIRYPILLPLSST